MTWLRTLLAALFGSMARAEAQTAQAAERNACIMPAPAYVDDPLAVERVEDFA